MARNGTETYYNEDDKSLYYVVKNGASNTTTTQSPVLSTVASGNVSGNPGYSVIASGNTTVVAMTTVTPRPLNLAKTNEGEISTTHVS